MLSLFCVFHLRFVGFLDFSRYSKKYHAIRKTKRKNTNGKTKKKHKKKEKNGWSKKKTQFRLQKIHFFIRGDIWGVPAKTARQTHAKNLGKWGEKHMQKNSEKGTKTTRFARFCVVFCRVFFACFSCFIWCFYDFFVQYFDVCLILFRQYLHTSGQPFWQVFLTLLRAPAGLPGQLSVISAGSLPLSDAIP